MTATILPTLKGVSAGPPPVEWSDEQLLVRYRQTRDEQLFAALVKRYERELFEYLRSYLRDSQLAEDTFQTTFLHVHMKCHQFDKNRRVRPWLYKIATNRAIDNQRSRRRRAAMSLNAPCDPCDPESSTWIDYLVGSTQSPPVQVMKRESRSKSLAAMYELPEHLRQVVLLIFFQGLKYREAAEVLSIPLGTVKSRMHAALRKLQDDLQPATFS